MRLSLSLVAVLFLWMAGCTSTPPDSPQLRNQTASLEMARQMVSQAEYQRAVQFLLPRSRQADAPAEVHTLLGLAFLGLNNPAVALKSFQAALKEDDKDDDTRVSIGYTLILLGKNEDARKILGDILKKNRYAFVEKVHLNIGLSYMQEKQCAKAMSSFQAALDIDPTYSAPHFNMGKCQSGSGRHKEAQASFQRAVDFCPGCIEPQLELALVSSRLGEKKKALQHLDAVLNARPTGVLEQRAMNLKRQLVN
jgi:Tfp pilus assembly protein PilF